MTSVKRACDACHRRKVRCDGRNPCENCSHASLACTFNAIPQKKGPKGSRAKVISEIRRIQDQTPRSINGSSNPLVISRLAYARTPGLLSPQIIQNCLDFFFRNMYPTMPILHRGRLQQQLHQLDHSAELYCLLTSLCAFMMIQPGMKTSGDDTPQSAMTQGKILLDEALRVRKSFDYIEGATSHSIITSFFFFGSYFGLDKHNTAWYHLREATTLVQILGMQDESGYLIGDPIDVALKRRLFWLLFVTERAYALQRHRPLTLHSTIALPTIEEGSPEVRELSGFLHLVNLFRPFDDTFVGLWNRSRSDCSTVWLSQLQNQLSTALPVYLNSTESQAADLRTSQQWLRTMVWKLSIQNGFLSPDASDQSMTLKYPLEIARDLVGVTSQLSRESMEVHGIGLIEKIFDIASTLTEVMSCVPIENHTFEFGPRDYLNQCLGLISTLRGGDSRFLPLILEKIDHNLPILAAPPPPPIPLLGSALMPWETDNDLSNTGSGVNSGASSINGGGSAPRIEEVFDSPSSNGSTGFLESPEVPLLDSFDYPPLPKLDDTTAGPHHQHLQHHQQSQHQQQMYPSGPPKLDDTQIYWETLAQNSNSNNLMNLDGVM